MKNPVRSILAVVIIVFMTADAALTTGKSLRATEATDGVSVDHAVPHNLSFTKNMGQWPEHILFRSETKDAVLWFAKDGIYHQYQHPLPPSTSNSQQASPARRDRNRIGNNDANEAAEIEYGTVLIKATFVGTNPDVAVVAEKQLTTTSNYFLGSDSRRWRSNVPQYQSISYVNLLPGVTLTYSADRSGMRASLPADNSSQSEVPMVISPVGAHPALQEELTRLVGSAESQFSSGIPAVRDADSRQNSSITQSASINTAILFSSQLGGNNTDHIAGIEVMSGPMWNYHANVVIAGSTLSNDFPSVDGFQQIKSANFDIFITRLSPSGSLVSSTYLGSPDSDGAVDMVLNSANQILVVGISGNFFSVGNYPQVDPIQSVGGDYDAVVSLLTPDCDSLIFSSYLGGTMYDAPAAVEIGPQQDIYIVGETLSHDFPLRNPFNPNRSGFNDGFLTVLNAQDKSIRYSTLIGGNSHEFIHGLMVDASGGAIVCGLTELSTDFPLKNAIKSTPTSAIETFVTRFGKDGDSLIFSTFFGGTQNDLVARIINGNASGEIFLSGTTYSRDLPGVPNPDTSANFDPQIFVSRMRLNGDSVLGSFVFGDSTGPQSVADMQKDYLGNIYITGETQGIDFTEVNPIVANFPLVDNYAAYITRLLPSADSIDFSSLYGGPGSHVGTGLAPDLGTSVWLVGHGDSVCMPVVGPGEEFQGGVDGFVTKISLAQSNCSASYSLGDVNCDGSGGPDILDLTVMVDHLFISFAPLCCEESANLDCTLGIDILDLTLMVEHLFISFTPLPNCP